MMPLGLSLTEYNMKKDIIRLRSENPLQAAQFF